MRPSSFSLVLLICLAITEKTWVLKDIVEPLGQPTLELVLIPDLSLYAELNPLCLSGIRVVGFSLLTVETTIITTYWALNKTTDFGSKASLSIHYFLFWDWNKFLFGFFYLVLFHTTETNTNLSILINKIDNYWQKKE